MKQFSAKTVEEAIANAVEELGISEKELIYTISDKKAGLFSKKMVIEVYEIEDVIQFAEEYLYSILDNLEIESSVKTEKEDDILRITVDSTHNPILIGKNGRTLQALNELVKLAVSNHFHKRFRILLDINGYKDNKYDRLNKVARRFARQVQRDKQTYTFAPMPADERRAVHNACSKMHNIRTESIGDGSHRQVQIIYVPSPAKEEKIEVEISEEEK